MASDTAQELKALDAYLETHNVYVRWDELEQCYMVTSFEGEDLSKFRKVEQAFAWALETALVQEKQWEIQADEEARGF